MASPCTTMQSSAAANTTLAASSTVRCSGVATGETAAARRGGDWQDSGGALRWQLARQRRRDEVATGETGAARHDANPSDSTSFPRYGRDMRTLGCFVVGF